MVQLWPNFCNVRACITLGESGRYVSALRYSVNFVSFFLCLSERSAYSEHLSARLDKIYGFFSVLERSMRYAATGRAVFSQELVYFVYGFYHVFTVRR